MGLPLDFNTGATFCPWQKVFPGESSPILTRATLLKEGGVSMKIKVIKEVVKKDPSLKQGAAGHGRIGR